MSMLILRILLLPFSFLYGIVTLIRNKLFDFNILKSKSFDVPTISVGNIEVGGTGKSPHVEYLINLLCDKYFVATLSRGYGRKTKGFIIADESKNYNDIGDEPLQFYKKHGNIIVSVDERRTHGVSELLKLENPPEVILLDDCYQHRWIVPGLNILLLDYNTFDTKQFMLPSGRLREFKSGKSRADIIIVTKSPTIFSPIEKRRLQDIIEVQPYQKLFFSYIDYQEMVPLTPCAEQMKLEGNLKLSETKTLVFAGIANVTPLVDYLGGVAKELFISEFTDHHSYSPADILGVISEFKDISLSKKIIITTEKDAMRLQDERLMPLIVDYPVFYIPIKVVVHQTDHEFDQDVLRYVERNK